MKTIQKNYLILSGIATGFIQMFPLMYSLKGTCSLDTMLATHAWIAIILWGGLGWIAKIANKRIQKALAIVIMISFGMSICFGPWSPLRISRKEGYISLLIFVMILTSIVAMMTTKKFSILTTESIILGMILADDNIADSISALNLIRFLKAIIHLTLEGWMSVLAFSLLFFLMIGLCLYLGEMALGSKKRK